MSSGQEALASIDTFNPDLILLDVMMPEMDGIELCRRLKEIPKWQIVPIIMVTALNTKEDLAVCLEAGADDFISKPVNSLELRSRVKSMLRIKKQYDYIQSFSKVQSDVINFLSDSLSDLRGNIASSLPHELNTPLNGVLVGLKLLIEDFENLQPEKVYELLDISYQSACRLENLTNKFLQYLQLELELTSFFDKNENSQVIDYIASSGLIKDIAMSIAMKYEREQDLLCDIETCQLSIFDRYLSSLTQELIDNAFKFSEAHTPVTVKGECKNGFFHLSITDQGIGMSSEEINKIEAFMQFKRGKYEQQGTGLGLQIAQKIIQLYDGSFEIKSMEKQQTTINLTLPLAR